MGTFNYSHHHWALNDSLHIERRHSKQQYDSTYEVEESDQRYLTGGVQQLQNIDVTHLVAGIASSDRPGSTGRAVVSVECPQLPSNGLTTAIGR